LLGIGLEGLSPRSECRRRECLRSNAEPDCPGNPLISSMQSIVVSSGSTRIGNNARSSPYDRAISHRYCTSRRASAGFESRPGPPGSFPWRYFLAYEPDKERGVELVRKRVPVNKGEEAEATIPGFPSESKVVTRTFHPADIPALCAAAVARQYPVTKPCVGVSAMRWEAAVAASVASGAAASVASAACGQLVPGYGRSAGGVKHHHPTPTGRPPVSQCPMMGLTTAPLFGNC
jgi:hypothetical protein